MQLQQGTGEEAATYHDTTPTDGSTEANTAAILDLANGYQGPKDFGLEDVSS
jgi:hypothetical protein